MRRLLLSLLAASLYAAPTVSNVSIVNFSHSEARIQFDSTSYGTLRISVNPSPDTCSGGGHGASGYFQQGLPSFRTSAQRWNIGGLAAATTYNICPQTSSDGGSTWSTGGQVSLTTLALPNPHPALPIAPKAFSTNFPSMAGAVTLTLGGAGCATLNACITTALTGQCTTPYYISLPDGTNITTGTPILFPQESCDVVANRKFTPADVNTTTSQIAIPSHGFSEGDEVQLAGHYGVGFPATSSCLPQLALFASGQTTTVHFIDSGHIQLYCPHTSTIALFTTQGSASSYFSIMPTSRPGLNAIVIASASAIAGTFAPEHTRVSPAWVPRMATLTQPLTGLNATAFGLALMITNTTDGSDGYQISNIRFVGLQFTTMDYAGAHTSSNPATWGIQLGLNAWNSHITFDRCYFHGQGTPNRMTANIFWDGAYEAFVDNYFDNLTAWRAVNNSPATMTNGTHIAIAAGAANGGQGNVAIPALTGTLSGGGSGTAYVWIDMANSNAFTVSTPASTSWSFSGGTVLSGPTATTSGFCGLNDPTNWPLDTHGAPTVIPLACVHITSGTITSVDQPQVGNASNNLLAEGCNFLISQFGPGPMKVENNFIKGAGLLWHHDDGGGFNYSRGDFTYTRNHFQGDLAWMYNPANVTAGISNGLTYYVRQFLEVKSGQRILLSGNLFDTYWDAGDVWGTTIINSVAGQGISDVDILSNTFEHGPNVMQGPLAVMDGSTPAAIGIDRYRFQNNLAFDIDGNRYFSIEENLTAGNSAYSEGPEGGEDHTYSHNSYIGPTNGGRLPTIWWTFGVGFEGMYSTNNFYYIWNQTQGVSQDGSAGGPCIGLLGQAQTDCIFTPANRNLIASNVLRSGDMTQSQINTAWPAALNIVPASMATSNVGWYNSSEVGNLGNFRLKSTSPYIHAANDGLDIGANINELEAAQGKVQLGGVPSGMITTTGATIAFLAPDAQGCPVDYSSTDPTMITSFTRQADAGGARARAVALSGLSSSTLYFYRINCAVQQPTGQFKTR